MNDASALPHAGLLALLGNVTSGQRVLINGAVGGVGPLGIQILKPYGAEVTSVDSGKKLS